MFLRELLTEAPWIGRNEYAGFSWDPRTKELTLPDGNKTTAASSDDARRVADQWRTRSSSAAAGAGKIENVKPKGMGKLEVTVDGKKYVGTVKELMDELGPRGAKVPGIEKAISEVPTRARAITGNIVRKVIRGLGVFGSFLAGAQATEDYSEEIARIDSFFENVVYKGSAFDRNNEAYQDMVKFHTYAYAANIGQIIVIEIGQWLLAGKVAKIIMGLRAGYAAAASTGLGAIVAVGLYLLTEGLMWAFEWWLRENGANYFRNWALEELENAHGLDSSPKNMPEVDKGEVADQIRQDRRRQDDGETYTPNLDAENLDDIRLY